MKDVTGDMKNLEIVRIKENFQIYNWLKSKDNAYYLNGNGKYKNWTWEIWKKNRGLKEKMPNCVKYIE